MVVVVDVVEGECQSERVAGPSKFREANKKGAGSC